MCHYCLYETDKDLEYKDISNYPSVNERILEENLRQFKGRSYVLYSDIIYFETQFQELETAYNDVCTKLDEAKLGK